jgi:hypothetical protein
MTVLLIIYLVGLLPAWYFIARYIWRQPKRPAEYGKFPGGKVSVAVPAGFVFATFWPLFALAFVALSIYDLGQKGNIGRYGRAIGTSCSGSTLKIRLAGWTDLC